MDECHSDIAGQRFGRLVASRSVRHKGAPHWICVCGCGRETGPIAPRKLRAGKSKSCGCARGESVRQVGYLNTRHGHAADGKRSRTYVIWQGMIQRCHNARSKYFSRYGGVGVVVCDRWHDFANFLEDMGEVPETLTIDRWPDNDGNYEPGNCRWATYTDQNRNRRIAVLVDGRPIADQAAELGITYGALYQRFKRAGKL